MNATDLHTFVVVAYRDSPFLPACLASLQAQTVQSQIVISTSTPTDRLDTLAREHGLPLVVNPSGEGGIAGDWNFAYQAGQTPFVTLAHQDDLYESDYTATFLDICRRNPDMLIGFSDYYELRDDKKNNRSSLLLVKRALLTPFWLWPVSRLRFFKRAILMLGNPVCCPSVWFNKAQIGAFAFTDAYRVNLDWEAWRRLADQTGSFAFARRKLVCHRKHADSESTVTLVSDIRRREDTALLSQVWGRQLGRLISAVYASGYRSYQDLLH